MKKMKKMTKNIIQSKNNPALIMTILCGCILQGTCFAGQQITGAGSSFIYPIMMQWTQAYHQAGNATINYQSIGSSAGVNQLKKNTIDFAATDEPVPSSVQKKYHWTQQAIASSGIVAIVNLPGISNNQLTLTGKALSDIYLGKIRYWDNPQLVKINPQLKLPHTMIITIHRADGSGTTYNFTKYLSEANPTWAKQQGTSTIIDWPGKYTLGANGNAGVATLVKQTPGSLGYVEYTYATTNQLSQVSMLHSNKILTATINSIVNCKLTSPNNICWPIKATTYLELVHGNKNNATLKQFFNWATHDKSMLQQAKKLGYKVNSIKNTLLT